MAEQQDRDQRTESATPQRILKAREEGQIGFSPEFVGGVIVATAVLMVWALGGSFLAALGNAISHRLSCFEPMIVDPRRLVGAMITDTQFIGMLCVAFILPLALIAGLSGLMQTGFNVSFKPLQLDWAKLSVSSGFGRIFSSKSAVRGGLSVVKATVIVAIFYLIAEAKMEAIAVAGFGSFRDLMFFMCAILLYVSIAIAAMMLTVGMIDLAFQKWKHLEDLKMSLRDIKDEHKESEGDPLIRARVRRLQAEMSRKRMLASVPEATVVITNPTHFAVAIRYDRETMDAPIVVAKGADFLAKKIIQIAREANVVVVERKPVARFLYSHVEVGSPIPFELYQAVAEVLNFVNRVRGGYVRH